MSYAVAQNADEERDQARPGVHWDRKQIGCSGFEACTRVSMVPSACVAGTYQAKPSAISLPHLSWSHEGGNTHLIDDSRGEQREGEQWSVTATR